MESSIYALVNNFISLHAATFDVTLGTHTYSDAMLPSMGIYITGISGFEEIPVLDNNEFRSEVNIYITA